MGISEDTPCFWTEILLFQHCIFAQATKNAVETLGAGHTLPSNFIELGVEPTEPTTAEYGSSAGLEVVNAHTPPTKVLLFAGLLQISL